MEITETDLAGLFVLRPTAHRDPRGLFTRTFDAALARAHGMELGPDCQDSQSRSVPGVLRGMHGRGGAGEAKLVRCASGAVWDIVVDARPGSPTLGRHHAMRLDDDDFVALWIPPGFLHGFQVIGERVAEVCYRIDRPHDPAEDIAVAWDDPDLALPWREQPRLISERDAAAGPWASVRG
ncbi:dTDP-4-dehydrorhamnose 3,5-epimerase family protein [Naumannella huperziae]